MAIFDANFIFSCLYFAFDVSNSISMDFEFNYQYTSFTQRRRIKKAEYFVENFPGISSILITCFSHLCELMVLIPIMIVYITIKDVIFKWLLINVFLVIGKV